MLADASCHVARCLYDVDELYWAQGSLKCDEEHGKHRNSAVVDLVDYKDDVENLRHEHDEEASLENVLLREELARDVDQEATQPI